MLNTTDNHLHLNVLHDTFGRDESASSARAFTANNIDFHWNADYTAFRLAQLSWWDDASYIAYQIRDTGDDNWDIDPENPSRKECNTPDEVYVYTSQAWAPMTCLSETSGDDIPF